MASPGLEREAGEHLDGKHSDGGPALQRRSCTPAFRGKNYLRSAAAVCYATETKNSLCVRPGEPTLNAASAAVEHAVSEKGPSPSNATNRLGPRWLNWVKSLLGLPWQRRLAWA